MAFPNFPAFRFWCQRVLPLVYDDSLSYYEVLCKVVTRLNELTEGMNLLNSQVTTNTADIASLKAELIIINNELEKIKNGEYLSSMIPGFEQIIAENVQKSVANIVKYVQFGLSIDGHFIASIPSTWGFLTFDTIIVPNSDLWGHLVLTW